MLTTTPLDHNFLKIRWRRRRDLNSRASFPTYTLSRGTSSPLEYFSKNISRILIFLEQPTLPVTPVYNNMDKNLLQVFLKKIKKFRGQFLTSKLLLSKQCFVVYLTLNLAKASSKDNVTLSFLPL